MNKHRVETLSDGVFAIIMTILVFNLHAPQITLLNDSSLLFNAILSMFPALMSYAVSFMVLAMFWTTHHAFFHSFLKNVDATLVQLNMFYLMLLGVLLFTTEILSKYPNNQAAIIIYGANIVIAGLAAYAIFLYAHHSPKIEMLPVSRADDIQASIRTLLTPAFAVLAIIASSYSYALAIVFFILPEFFNFLPKTLKYCERLLGIKI